MSEITMTQFRRNTQEIIERVVSGKQMVLTYEGKPVMRLQPIPGDQWCDNESFYDLPELAASRGESISNETMDRVIYGQRD